MERYDDEEQRRSAGRLAATRRDAFPCDAWRRWPENLDDPLHWVGLRFLGRLALRRNWRRRGHVAFR